MPGTALVLTVVAGWVWAVHALWPLTPPASLARLHPRRVAWWALALAVTAVLCQAAAWMASTDRILHLGGALSVPAARFALVAAAGVVTADLVAALRASAGVPDAHARREPTERRAATLRGILGATALLGFFWAFESARTWQVSVPGAGARAASLGLIGVSLVRPRGRTAWLATLVIGGTVAYLALLPSALRGRIASPTAIAPLLGGLLLLTSEPFLPRRLQGMARALGSMLLLVLMALVFYSSRAT